VLAPLVVVLATPVPVPPSSSKPEIPRRQQEASAMLADASAMAFRTHTASEPRSFADRRKGRRSQAKAGHDHQEPVTKAKTSDPGALAAVLSW
jgi:hypothetical protein